jgi:hypothetical protein
MRAHRRTTPIAVWTKRSCCVALAATAWAMVSKFGWWAVALMIAGVLVAVIWMAADD